MSRARPNPCWLTLPRAAVFASNTSTLPISGLACQRPAAQVHRHPFLQPGGQDEVGGDHPRAGNRRETVAHAYDYVQALGKIPSWSMMRGFYTSRTFGTYVMECAAMLGEGIPLP